MGFLRTTHVYVFDNHLELTAKEDESLIVEHTIEEIRERLSE